MNNHPIKISQGKGKIYIEGYDESCGEYKEVEVSREDIKHLIEYGEDYLERTKDVYTTLKKGKMVYVKNRYTGFVVITANTRFVSMEQVVKLCEKLNDEWRRSK